MENELRKTINRSTAQRKGRNSYYIKDGCAYVKLTCSTKTMICDEEDWERWKSFTWQESGGYARTRILGKHTRFHRLVVNAPKGMEIDHINRNKLDNRKSNLRIVSHKANMLNRGKTRKSTTGIAGVYQKKGDTKYFAQIKVNEERLYLGKFESIEEAKKARLNAEKEYRDTFIEKETLQAGCFFNK